MHPPKPFSRGYRRSGERYHRRWYQAWNTTPCASSQHLNDAHQWWSHGQNGRRKSRRPFHLWQCRYPRCHGATNAGNKRLQTPQKTFTKSTPPAIPMTTERQIGTVGYRNSTTTHLSKAAATSHRRQTSLIARNSAIGPWRALQYLHVTRLLTLH